MGKNTAGAADLEAARQAFDSGRYDECITQAQQALKSKEDLEDWGALLSRGADDQGPLPAGTDRGHERPGRRTAQHLFALERAERASPMVKPAAADKMAAEIQQLFTSRYWLYSNARDLVIFGRVALEGGMEPKLALDRIYDAAKKAEPKCPDAYLASGELALEKHDFALAARFFQEGAQATAGRTRTCTWAWHRPTRPATRGLMLNSLTDGARTEQQPRGQPSAAGRPQHRCRGLPGSRSSSCHGSRPSILRTRKRGPIGR